MKVTNNLPQVPARIITIVMDELEAAVLLKVCNRIGGSCVRGPRVTMSELGHGLELAGIKPADLDADGNIHFTGDF